MSTKSTVITGHVGELRMDLHHEMHDDLYHFELWDDASNSSIEAIIPHHMVDDLRKMFTGQGTKDTAHKVISVTQTKE